MKLRLNHYRICNMNYLAIIMLQKHAIADSEYLVIEGDQKLYEVLQSLKFEYGKELDWAIPIPGNWHMCDIVGSRINYNFLSRIIS